MISLIGELLKSTNEYKKLTTELVGKEVKKKSIKDKVTNNFFEKLLLKPFIFYVKNDTLPTSNAYESFEKFSDKIFYIEDIYRLLLCQQLLPVGNRAYEVNWIIMESKVEIKKTRDINNIPFLEYWMSKHVKNNTSGKLDYSRMDEMFFEVHNKNDLSKYFKKPGTYFYTNILNLNLTDRKSSYATHELRYYESPNCIIIDKKDIVKKYNYICPICDHNYPIFLCENDNSNVKSFIKQNSRYIEFDCDHKGTKYENKAKFGFSINKHPFDLHTDEDCNKAFLYLFYLAKPGEECFEYNDKDNKLQQWKLDDYFKIRADKDV